MEAMGAKKGYKALTDQEDLHRNCRRKGISFISFLISTVPFPQRQSHHERNESLAECVGGGWRDLESILYLLKLIYTDSMSHLWFHY